ncbi:hypothetical protein [Mycobacterium sp. 1081908.1]|uniref:hypothetical protein n=1 Tax=Mycobacterium sp. 1081908.1 TaxID=1834066 RepID=UPI0007FFB6E7|nr:hypothetical protein [Mycobacterium sp. 1081908.1]OBK44788.1 hypothetical protein A5655_13555 [Mycobacterium sp. 1081908.1]
MAPTWRSDPANDTPFYEMPRPEIPGPDGHPVPLDVEAEAERLSSLTRQGIDSPEIADGYMRIALQEGTRGAKGFDAMMDYLQKALEIRKKLFDRYDPLLGRTYRVLCDLSVGKVPLENSIGWLENWIEIAEHHIGSGIRPQIWNQYYMNESYKQLARWYRVSGRPDLARQTLDKIR